MSNFIKKPGVILACFVLVSAARAQLLQSNVVAATAQTIANTSSNQVMQNAQSAINSSSNSLQGQISAGGVSQTVLNTTSNSIIGNAQTAINASSNSIVGTEQAAINASSNSVVGTSQAAINASSNSVVGTSQTIVNTSSNLVMGNAQSAINASSNSLQSQISAGGITQTVLNSTSNSIIGNAQTAINAASNSLAGTAQTIANTSSNLVIGNAQSAINAASNSLAGTSQTIANTTSNLVMQNTVDPGVVAEVGFTNLIGIGANSNIWTIELSTGMVLVATAPHAAKLVVVDGVQITNLQAPEIVLTPTSNQTNYTLNFSAARKQLLIPNGTNANFTFSNIATNREIDLYVDGTQESNSCIITFPAHVRLNHYASLVVTNGQAGYYHLDIWRGTDNTNVVVTGGDYYTIQ